LSWRAFLGRARGGSVIFCVCADSKHLVSRYETILVHKGVGFGRTSEIKLQKNGCLVNQIIVARLVIRASEKTDRLFAVSVRPGALIAHFGMDCACLLRFVPIRDTFSGDGGLLLSGKTDECSVSGNFAFNLGITRANRIEVVCLHSLNNVVNLSINFSCLFFRTNQRGVDGKNVFFRIIFFYFWWLFLFFRMA
jgi:hypothetical protein